MLMTSEPFLKYETKAEDNQTAGSHKHLIHSGQTLLVQDIVDTARRILLKIKLFNLSLFYSTISNV